MSLIENIITQATHSARDEHSATRLHRRWATVVTVDPLRVVMDGEHEVMDVPPNLLSEVSAGSRVVVDKVGGLSTITGSNVSSGPEVVEVELTDTTNFEPWTAGAPLVATRTGNVVEIHGELRLKNGGFLDTNVAQPFAVLPVGWLPSGSAPRQFLQTSNGRDTWVLRVDTLGDGALYAYKHTGSGTRLYVNATYTMDGTKTSRFARGTIGKGYVEGTDFDVVAQAGVNRHLWTSLSIHGGEMEQPSTFAAEDFAAAMGANFYAFKATRGQSSFADLHFAATDDPRCINLVSQSQYCFSFHTGSTGSQDQDKQVFVGGRDAAGRAFIVQRFNDLGIHAVDAWDYPYNLRGYGTANPVNRTARRMGIQFEVNRDYRGSFISDPSWISDPQQRVVSRSELTDEYYRFMEAVVLIGKEYSGMV